MVSVSGTSAGRWIAVAMGVAMVVAMVGATGFPGDGLQAGDVIYVCDSTEDSVYRLEDKDGDGSIAGPDEVLTFYDDTSAGPDLSVPSHLLLWGDGLLVLDGGTLDAILLLVDGNNDGDALDEGEVTVFYDNDGKGPNLATPNTLAVGPDGCIYVADDGAAVKAILRLVDNNDDGDALDEDEASIFYDTSALSPAEPLSDPESLVVSADGSVYVGNSATGSVYRLEDLNDDGDALDADEATLFYDGGAEVEISDIDTLLLTTDGTLVVIDEDTGTVLLLQDNDGDGSASGDEVQVLVDGSDPDTTFDDPNDAVLLADGSLLIADGGLDALLRVVDLDDDGSATGAGEQELFFDDGGVLLSTPSGLAVAIAAEPPPPAAIFLRGDTDADGNLRLADAFGILRNLFEDVPHPCPAALDIDDDDLVTLEDAIALLQYLYLEGPQPEPPFPTPGTDPTPETLGCAP